MIYLLVREIKFGIAIGTRIAVEFLSIVLKCKDYRRQREYLATKLADY
jgi:hypothetical protein